MAEKSLDQIVKGAPPPNTSLTSLAANVAGHTPPLERTSGSTSGSTPTPTPSDPTLLLPSSPPQIYLNLLILEASLRQQYLTLRARRREHTFVVSFLAVWIFWFGYAQFLRPREDGAGVGGSVYWIVDMAEKVAFIGGIVMGILFKVTGQWERGVKWPQRWLPITNRGLRSMNLKMVVLKGPWWKETLSNIFFLLPLQLLFPTPGSNYHFIDYTASEKRSMMSQGRPRHGSAEGSRTEFAEEDVAPGGDYIKILLLPKQFTPDFRENWELYRNEYWGQENMRRAELRKRIRAREQEIAKQEGGWLWWTGWRGWSRLWGLTSPRPQEHPPHHVHSQAYAANLKEKHRRRPSVIKAEKEGSHSRSSSRSSTVTAPDLDDRERRWSTASSGSVNEKRRRSRLINSTDLGRSGSVTNRPSRLTPARDGPGASPVPTAENITALKSRSSNLSTRSTGSDSSEGKAARARNTGTPDPVIKTEPPEYG
jgi:hypothetical protein